MIWLLLCLELVGADPWGRREADGRNMLERISVLWRLCLGHYVPLTTARELETLPFLLLRSQGAQWPLELLSFDTVILWAKMESFSHHLSLWPAFAWKEQQVIGWAFSSAL